MVVLSVGWVDVAIRQGTDTFRSVPGLLLRNQLAKRRTDMPPTQEAKQQTKRTFSKLKASKFPYVVINGLCFLHYDPSGKNLLVTAPQVMDHVYLRGCPSSEHSLKRLEEDLDFTAPGLLTGNDKRELVFPPGLPQF